MTASRFRRSSALALAGLTMGAVLLPGAALADGPGYGGTADALTVQWQESSSDLAVYAVGFRGGSTVQLQVGSQGDSTVSADVSGALRVLVVPASSAILGAADTTVLRVTDAAGPGTSILVTGQTPAGSLRTLVGSVPPVASGTGASGLIPWAVAAAALTAGAAWLAARTQKPGRHRPGRHRMV
ncbi:hypothetical protein [Symbioplanes lichenis]|uniref:hypothetical protein n=1 Tax=Symbioplanes lichenis TaxID=1629072 RepID=UPI0027385A76|nr:hypothetical protein [Actinoplanes lichenis]